MIYDSYLFITLIIISITILQKLRNTAFSQGPGGTSRRPVREWIFWGGKANQLIVISHRIKKHAMVWASWKGIV